MKKLFLALALTSIFTHGQIKTGRIEYDLVISDDVELEKGQMSEYFADAKKMQFMYPIPLILIQQK